jgi:hypothetical protein
LPAAVGIIRDDGIPTPGMPGFKTITLSAVSDSPITAFDFVGDGGNDSAIDFGFFGPMNHINPLGQATVFQDFNDLFPSIGADVKQDSQFLVRSANVVLPPGFAEEGPNILQAAWAWPESPGTTIPFAQLVIAEADTPTIFYRGAITALVNGVHTDFPVSNFPGPAPTPPVVVDVNSIHATRGNLINRLFETSQGTSPITWDKLVVTSPGFGSPVSIPSLSSAGEFNWQTSPTDALGTYHFDVTATNAVGSDVGRLTINLLPSGQPPVAADVVLGDRQQGSLITTQFTATEGMPPITWDNLVVAGPNGSLPTNVPTLTSNGQFNWLTTANDALGAWQFDVTATNAEGSDAARLTLNLVAPIAPGIVDRDLGVVRPGALVLSQLLTSEGTPPITWENLRLTTPDGSVPVNAPTLSPSSQLRWLTSDEDALGLYEIDVTALNVAGSDVGRIRLELRPLPVGPVVVDANLGNAQQGNLVQHQFTTSQGTPPITWGDLRLIRRDGNAPVNAPTLSDTGALSWQTTAQDTVGTYHFELIATNSERSDSGYLTVDVLDQPPAPGSPVVVDVDLGVEDGPITHQFATSAGDGPMTWSDLVAIGPGGRALVGTPTLSETGELRWIPDEADVSGTYFFDVVASNSFGSDFGHLMVRFSPSVEIPEPATWLMLLGSLLWLPRVRRRA